MDCFNYHEDVVMIEYPNTPQVNRRKKRVSNRHQYLFIWPIVIVVLLILADPDSQLIQELPFGSGVITKFLFIVSGVIATALLHFTRKFLFDYDAADMEKLGLKARETPEGAGQYAIAISIQTLAFAIVIVGAFFV